MYNLTLTMKGVDSFFPKLKILDIRALIEKFCLQDVMSSAVIWCYVSF